MGAQQPSGGRASCECPLAATQACCSACQAGGLAGLAVAPSNRAGATAARGAGLRAKQALGGVKRRFSHLLRARRKCMPAWSARKRSC